VTNEAAPNHATADDLRIHESERDRRARTVEARLGLQLDVLGALLVLAGAFFGVGAWLGLFTVDPSIVGAGALLFPIGAGLMARSKLAANLAFLLAAGAIVIASVSVVLYAVGSQAFDFESSLDPRGEAIAARVVDGLLACIVPLWSLRILWLAHELRLFDARALEHPDRHERRLAKKRHDRAQSRSGRRSTRPGAPTTHPGAPRS